MMFSTLFTDGLVALCCFYSIITFDLFCLDIFYWLLQLGRLFSRNTDLLSYENLTAIPEKKLAVIISCWRQFDLIETMLKHNIYSIDYENYDFFVVAHTNDLETILAIKTTARSLPHIQVVINPVPGPQNHASNFNAAYQHIQNYVKETQQPYAAYIIHYANEVIHPQAFKLYNSILATESVVQLPINYVKTYPETKLSKLFYYLRGEALSKDLPTLARLSSLLPINYGGIAYRHDALQRLAEQLNNKPFQAYARKNSFDPAIAVKNAGLRVSYALRYYLKTVWRTQGDVFGPPVAVIEAEPVTSLQHNPQFSYTYIQDRAYQLYKDLTVSWLAAKRGWLAKCYAICNLYRQLLLAPLIMLIYMVLAGGIIQILLSPLPKLSQLAYAILITSLLLALNRGLQQSIVIGRMYGWRAATQAFLSLPYQHLLQIKIFFLLLRLLTNDNLENQLATTLQHSKSHFPLTPALERYTSKLGELLISNELITESQLKKALELQSKSGKRLGLILLENDLINRNHLMKFLAKQFDIPIIHSKHARTLSAAEIKLLAPTAYAKLINNKNYPIAVEDDELTVVINDPSNDIELATVLRLASNYKVNFVLVQD